MSVYYVEILKDRNRLKAIFDILDLILKQRIDDLLSTGKDEAQTEPWITVCLPFVSVLVCKGCHNKAPQTGRLKP